MAIKAQDVERLTAFYREVLGLEERARHRDDNGALRSIWLELGGAILMIERSSTGFSRTPADFKDDPPGIHVLALSIAAKDKAAIETMLVSRGASIVHRTDYTLYLLDPEGNRIGLSSYPERA